MQLSFKEQIKMKSDAELGQIFLNPHDYQPEYVRLAEEEMIERQIDLAPYRYKLNLKEKTATSISLKKEEGDITYIIIGFGFALLGGIIGFIMGYHYAWSKKSLPGQTADYHYTELTRDYGKAMMVISVLAIIFYTTKLYEI